MSTCSVNLFLDTIGSSAKCKSIRQLHRFCQSLNGNYFILACTVSKNIHELEVLQNIFVERCQQFLAIKCLCFILSLSWRGGGFDRERERGRGDLSLDYTYGTKQNMIFVFQSLAHFVYITISISLIFFCRCQDFILLYGKVKSYHVYMSYFLVYPSNDRH